MWRRFSFRARVIALALVVNFANAQDSLNVRQVGLYTFGESVNSIVVVDTLAYVARAQLVCGS